RPGSSAIVTYQWQSGDGNDTGLVAENSFTTIYTAPGTYFPTVTVADANGLSDSASRTITINAQLNGVAWTLSDTLPGTSITLEAGNGTLSGFAGCNTYNGTFSSTLMAGPTNNITVGPLRTTSMACSEEIMDQEQAYLANLESASSYTISGSTLTLTTAGGPLVFNAAIAVPLPAVE
ncbi:MAG: META domain-containing protein, partial [Candidatus Promineifilaceae bacterium]